MADENIESGSDAGAADTPTYLYPSSDNTVLMQETELEEVPFRTGKHSVIGGKKVNARTNEVKDPFAPKTDEDFPPAIEHIAKPKKRHGCLRAFIAVVLAVVVIAAAVFIDSSIYYLSTQ